MNGRVIHSSRRFGTDQKFPSQILAALACRIPTQEHVRLSETDLEACSFQNSGFYRHADSIPLSFAMFKILSFDSRE